MRNKRRNGMIAVITMLMTGSPGAEPARFTVAIVRTDGRLVPFAAWNGAEWERAWPEADEPTHGTTAIDEVPSIWRKRGERVPRLWHVWAAAGGGSVRATVRDVELVAAHCSGQIVLKTDFPEPRRVNPMDAVEGSFGVAMDDPAVPVAAIQELVRTDPLWKEAERVVRGGDDALRLSTLYRQKGSPRSWLYFASEHADGRAPDAMCPGRTVVSGWLVPTQTGLRLVDPRSFVTDCDDKEVRTLSPLGALRVGRRDFWVLQDHGYEDEKYVIAEVGPSGIRYSISVDGGGC